MPLTSVLLLLLCRIRYVEKDGIQFEVFGSQDATAERPPTASAGGALGPTKQEVEAMQERLQSAQQNANEAQRKLVRVRFASRAALRLGVGLTRCHPRVRPPGNP